MATILFSNGHSIPVIGFGTGTKWFAGPGKNSEQRDPNPTLVASLTGALEAGFRHLDGAENYGTDLEVGLAIRSFLSAHPDATRADLFVTSKAFPSIPDVRSCCTGTLQRMGLDYLDLFLIHAPFFNEVMIAKGATIESVWKNMETLVDDGLVKSIGVSNFRPSDLKRILAIARIKPVMNQVEWHANLQSPELIEICNENKIILAAYGSLVPIRHLAGDEVDIVSKEIAKSKGVTDGQVLLRWTIQRGVVPITTTENPERIQQFLVVADGVRGPSSFTLTDDEVSKINEAGKRKQFRKFWAQQFEAQGHL
ncbi:NADP-dependent oxidoreductase domain-containing protein [Cladochytrium replicatum]|nr:NADP-dependent oxidoreductase domain-containing protein [Cladochytrium replicatum]